MARIAAVADAYDAMCSPRPYRRALSVRQALAVLREGRAAQFDPEIVDLFIREKIYRLDVDRRCREGKVRLRLETGELDRVNARLKRARMGPIRILPATLEGRDSDNEGHCIRVSLYARAIAADLNFRDGDLESLEYAAYLHDIGKAGIPVGVLMKAGPLTDEEYGIIKEHPRIGANIVKRYHT